MKNTQSRQLAVLAILIIALPTVVFGAIGSRDFWQGDYTLQPGVQGSVDAIVQFEDNLVLGGEIVAAGNTVVNSIVFWTGTEWIHPGDGLDGPVNDLIVFNEMLYAAGEFSHGVAVWNGSTWDAVDENISGTVKSLVVYHDELVLLGDFSVDGIDNCASWSGIDWTGFEGNLSEPCVDGVVLNNILWIASDDLYAFDGAGWATYEFEGTINAVAAIDEKLIVGGNGIYQSGESLFDSAAYDGQEWAALPTSGGYSIVDLFKTSSNELYYAASEDNPGPQGQSKFKVGKHSIAGWSTVLDTGVLIFGQPNTLGEYNGELVVGGQFDRVDNILTSNVIVAGEFYMSPVGQATSGAGVSGPVYGMSVSNDELLVAGSFSFAGAASAGGVARYNGFTWSPEIVSLVHWQSEDPNYNLESTSLLQKGVHHLVEYGGTSFAGGNFEFQNPYDINIQFSNLATIEGQSWTVFAQAQFSDQGIEVTGLLTHKNLLYIAGASADNFDTVLYSWDGASLVNVTNGLTGRVVGIDDVGDFLYCAVQTDAENVRVVKYDCVAWDDLGSFTGTALDIKAIDGAAYVTTADGVWFADGSASRYGTSNGPVYTAEVYQGDLVVGGLFSEIDGLSTDNLARLSNDTWESIGDVLVNQDSEPGFHGEGNGVHSLQVYQGNLMIGGEFYSVDNAAASNISRYNDHDNLAPELTIGVHTNPYANQFIDIYLTGDDTQLLSNMIELDVSEAPIYMEKFDESGFFWRGEYRLYWPGDAFEINACAWDESWQTGCVTLPLSTMMISGDNGGMIASIDQQMELYLPADSFDGETVAMIAQGTEMVETQEGGVQLFRQKANTMNTVYDVRGPNELTKPATISFQISGNNSPEGWYIERADGTALESLVDTETNRVSARVTEFGGFVVKWSPSAGSQIADRRFLSMSGAVPNPFNPMTTIEFEIKANMHVSAVVIDLRGRTIATLLNEEITAGSHTLRWNGRTDGGAQAASGTYMVQVRTNEGGLVSSKMTLAR
ncbi:MAG: hypothetical protein GY752_05690 [bacterium]|nr:hypothetical protein [bacterium]